MWKTIYHFLDLGQFFNGLAGLIYSCSNAVKHLTKGLDTMNLIITNWGMPIKTLSTGGNFIRYSLFDKGIRLVDINGRDHNKLSNFEFHHIMNIVLNHEGITK